MSPIARLLMGTILVSVSLPALALEGVPRRIERFVPGAEWLSLSGREKEVVLQPAATARPAGARSAWTVRTTGPRGLFTTSWGAGIPAGADAMYDRVAAERAARAFFEANPWLLPDGITLDDLEPLANTLQAETRFVSFRQLADGMPVVGGSAFVAIKAGRIVMSGTRLWAGPNSLVPVRISPASAAELARLALSQAGVDGPLTLEGDGGLVALPLFEQGGIRLRAARQTVVRGPAGRWTAWVDAGDGRLLGLRDERVFMEGAIRMTVHDRSPGGDLIARPASFLDYTISGLTMNLDSEGRLSIPGTSPDIGLKVEGSYVRVSNAYGDNLTTSIPAMADGAVFVWSAGGEYAIAQLDAYRFVEDARQYAIGIAPEVGWLTRQLQVNVNHSDSEYPACNGWFDGSSITLLRSGTAGYGYSCNNTATIADVIYHEFGHGFHYYSVVPGVGQFDEAVSEGLADFTSARLTGDSVIAPHFLTSGQALRDIEPDRVWPEDQAEDPHVTGLIVSGALWDLGKVLVAEQGASGAVAVDRIFAGIARTAGSVPTVFESALLADDDNGDLADGTPNYCSILAAFGPHGLVPGSAGGLSIDHAPIGNVASGLAPLPVEARVSVVNPECGDAIRGEVRLVWSADSGESWRTRRMDSEDGERFSAELPAFHPGTQVRYRIEVDDLKRGMTVTLPANPAEPFYRAYIGGLSPIACDDFETADPGWTHALLTGQPREGADDWQWDQPRGRGGDPAAARSGRYVWGNDLAPQDNWNGQYQSDKTNTLRSPVYDLSAHPHVRLQFYRWLTVEDGTYDRARIYVNEQPVWVNAAGAGSLHHVDAEWVLFDLDITPQAGSRGAVQLRWEIESDAGLEFGGWTIDDFCLYAFEPAPPVDGDEVIDGDGPVDGDMAPDGDEMSDGDLPVDGDGMIDGDGPLDGDEVIDGDGAADGDETTDGDLPVDGDESVDGDGMPDGDADQTDQTDSDLPDGDAPDGDAIADGDMAVDGDTTADGDEPVDGDSADGDQAPDGDAPVQIGGGGCDGSAGNGNAGWLSIAAGLLLFGARRRELKLAPTSSRAE